MSIVFFKTVGLKSTSHPDYQSTETWVGSAVVEERGEDLEIDITRLYLSVDIQRSDSPTAYNRVDEENREFKKTAAYSSIIMDIEDRYGKSGSNDSDAMIVTNYYESKKY